MVSLGRVLVVDDNPVVLRAHGRLVERAGYAVVMVEDGQAALEELERPPGFDVVLSDIAMPHMSGVELLREIRRRDNDVPVVFLTGAPALETAIEAVALGALRYLQKPVRLAELRSILGRAVQLRRLGKLKQQALALLAEHDRRIVLGLDAEQTFERGLAGLWLAAQPIVSLRRRQVVAYEALLRTREATITKPEDFLELAAQVGGMTRLGRAIRAHAARLSASLGPGLELLVNVDALDLLDPELYLESAPLSARAPHVVLELTERASLECVDGLAARVEQLRALGFQVAIDDLGAGYAGLSSLAQLDAEVAKIDISLIHDIDGDPRKAKLVAALNETCTLLGQRVVVEGVETAAERDRLGELGCDLMQGYFFGYPLEAPASVSDGAFA